MPSPINNFLRTCPDSPGIYKFFHNNQIIYIGKAKNLSKRVRSYFTKSLKDRKTEQIKKLTDKIETLSKHIKQFKKDKHSSVGLLRAVNRRKKLLDYLKKNNIESYKAVLTKLNLRK